MAAFVQLLIALLFHVSVATAPAETTPTPSPEPTPIATPSPPTPEPTLHTNAGVLQDCIDRGKAAYPNDSSMWIWCGGNGGGQ